MIYLDNAATTYPKPEEMYTTNDYAQRNLAFNAGRGSYNLSKQATEKIDKCRKFLCSKSNAKSCLFTPSATHSLNMIIRGLDLLENDIVYCSPYDHNAVVRTLYELSLINNFVVKEIALNDDLSIDLDKFNYDCIKDKPKAIFCTHVSNVTGYVLPIKEMGEIAKKNHAIFIVDGAQSFGLIPVNLIKDNIDMFVFAGHKTLYGPFGIAGILFRDSNISLKTSLFGGTGTDSLNTFMPNDDIIKYEPSSPNVVAISSLFASSKWVFEKNVLSHEKKLTSYFINGIKELEDIIVYEVPNDDYCGIVSFNVRGFKSAEVAKILENDFDILVRSDFHCSPFIHKYIKSIDYLGTVRVSFSYFNTIKECDRLISALEEIIYEF